MARPRLTKEQLKEMKIAIINSTRIYIKKNGYDKVTAREISKLSEVNVAYIYRLFSSLNEILLYCSIPELFEYFNDLIKNNVLLNTTNYKTIYYEIWKYFLSYALKYRESYKYLYYSESSINLKNIILNYIELFPNTLMPAPEKLKNLFISSEVNGRTDYALYKAFGDKFSKKELETISILTDCYFKRLLTETDKTDAVTINDQIKKFMYVTKFLHQDIK